LLIEAIKELNKELLIIKYDVEQLKNKEN